MMRNRWIAAVIAVSAASCGWTLAGGIATGDAAPDFALPDTRGNTHGLKDYPGKYVVLEWTNYECPFVKKHYNSGNMQALQKTYTDKGVVWLTICSSARGKQGNAEADEIHRTNGANGFAATAYLIDEDGAVGKKFGARTTPHLFIINPDRKLGYQGAIDSVRSTDPKDVPEAMNYVREYLDLMMNGESPSHTTTQPYGCGVKYGG